MNQQKNGVNNPNKNINNLLHRIGHWNHMNQPCLYTKDMIARHVKYMKQSHIYGDFIKSRYKLPQWNKTSCYALLDNWDGYQLHTLKYKNVVFRVETVETRYNRRMFDFAIHQNLLVNKESDDYLINNKPNGSDDDSFIEKDFKSWVINSIPHDNTFFFSHISPIKFSINCGFLLSGVFILFALYVFFLHSLFASLFVALCLISIIVYEILIFYKTLNPSWTIKKK